MVTPWTDLLSGAFPQGVFAPTPPPPPPRVSKTQGEGVEAARADGKLAPPTTRLELQRWCKQWAGVALPLLPVCAGHNTPLDYLEYVFFEQGDDDPVVWACRGGGKTLMGAVATLLDMVFKPGIEIRILGGSQTQSERMYEHLVRMVDANFRDQMIRSGRFGRMTKTGFTFANGSRVELLGQSESSVRGARVQKVRCDEVDLFAQNVWDAVQLTTRSKPLGNGANQKNIRGTIEAFSTMNGPSGVMNSLIGDKGRRLFTWCVWDVIQQCKDDCIGCNLLTDCQSRAHSSEGFIPVSDVRTMRDRVADKTWRYEVLCQPTIKGKALSPITVRTY